MNRLHWQILVLAVSGIALTIGISGCSVRYEYEITGQIKDSSDGSPLEGVRIELKMRNNDLTSFDGESTSQTDGAFAMEYGADPYDVLPNVRSTWRLLLKKDGYEDEILKIPSTKEPSAKGGTNQIAVLVYMRKKLLELPKQD